jgi:hypothetical protein
LSSSGPHRLFRFLFTVVVEAGFPGTAGEGALAGVGAGKVGQVVGRGEGPEGASGGDLRLRLRSRSVGVPAEPALAFRNSSSFCR